MTTSRILFALGAVVLVLVLVYLTIGSSPRSKSRTNPKIDLVVGIDGSNADPGRLAVEEPARPGEWPKNPNVLLVSIDTLRADHLGAYGARRDVSPAIDRLAEDAVLFDRAFVAVPKTTPSLVSLLSGLHPKSHGVRKLRVAASDKLPLLPERLQTAGYATAGFCGQFNCARKWGLGRGFDLYEDRFDYDVGHDPDRVGGGFYPASEKRAADLVDRTIDWIEEQRGQSQPFFAWLHLMDPHAGYSPPSPYLDMFAGTTAFSANSVHGNSVPPDLIHVQAKIEGKEDYDDYVNRYDGEIRYLDDQLVRLFDYLKKEELYRDSLIVLTADHGEFMGEVDNGVRYFTHGGTLHESELRVPLIVKLPARFAAGTRVSRLVSLVDIAPTISGCSGWRLRPLMA
jgi:arylsulfatase A-like enzyme